MERDQHINTRLNEMGWIVLRFWDFEVKKDLPLCIDKTIAAIEERKRSLQMVWGKTNEVCQLWLPIVDGTYPQEYNLLVLPLFV